MCRFLTDRFVRTPFLIQKNVVRIIKKRRWEEMRNNPVIIYKFCSLSKLEQWTSVGTMSSWHRLWWNFSDLSSMLSFPLKSKKCVSRYFYARARQIKNPTEHVPLSPLSRESDNSKALIFRPNPLLQLLLLLTTVNVRTRVSRANNGFLKLSLHDLVSFNVCYVVA